MTTKLHAEWIQALIPAMRQAGQLIEQYRQTGYAVRQKAESIGSPPSPVTDADEAAEALLAAAIRHLDPQAVIVGEEASACGQQPAPATRFWLIDPLDGTRDYIRGGQDYSVNIGLIEHAEPVLGLVLHPPSATLWAGANALGAFREMPGQPRTSIRCRPFATPPLVATSSSNLDARTRAFLALLPQANVRPMGSSLKFCLLADGEADLYLRHGPTSEWDTAAGDAILRAAGGLTLGPDRQSFLYGKADYLNGPFLALGDPKVRSQLPPFPVPG